ARLKAAARPSSQLLPCFRVSISMRTWPGSSLRAGAGANGVAVRGAAGAVVTGTVVTGTVLRTGTGAVAARGATTSVWVTTAMPSVGRGAGTTASGARTTGIGVAWNGVASAPSLRGVGAKRRAILEIRPPEWAGSATIRGDGA